MPARYFLVCCCSLIAFLSQAQVDRTVFQQQFQLHVLSNEETPIRVDGDLSEPVWQNPESARNFWLKWPRAGETAPTQTEVRVTHDDKYLYVGTTCYDTGAYIIRSLKRDVEYWESDGVAIVLDPANRAVNGYFFAVTAAGVQTEGLLSNNDDDSDFTWDNRWFVEVKTYADRWTAEFAIPFQIIRFDADQKEWGINFIRNDPSNGQWSTWTNIPLQFNGIDLGYTGKLLWKKTPGRAKGNYNISPYITGSVSRDYENKEAWKASPDAGVDAKIGIGSAMNLDLTINPDFSQIEVDEQVINLTRFDIQLPEKRTFFLENADIFANYGIPPIRPFFSRRIGLDENGQPRPIQYGLRLTGNLNTDTRIGVLNMHTRKSDGFRAQNYSAVSVQRRLFGRSNLSGYFLNRQAAADGELLPNDYTRNAGIEFGYTKTDGSFSCWATHHHAFQPGISTKDWWGNTGIYISREKFDLLVDFTHMGENYRADMGFETRIENYDAALDTVIRLGYNFAFAQANYRIVPRSADSRFNIHFVNVESFSVINPDGSLNEHSNRIEWESQFKNTSSLTGGMSYFTANVPVAFKFDDKSNEECPPLPAGQYDFFQAGVSWDSDNRKRLTYGLEALHGQFYEGTQTSFSANLGYRAQPWGNIRIKAEYNLLDFPEPYCDAAFFAVTPRIEIFFNRNLNWTTFLQFINQADNFNINSRVQWRFRPMSDLFVVYTDNYTVQNFGPKNRALVLKLNYWL